jgi:hypothetical protein
VHPTGCLRCDFKYLTIRLTSMPVSTAVRRMVVKQSCTSSLLSLCSCQTVILEDDYLLAMLQDLAEVDELICELGDLKGTSAKNAAEKLMQTCSQSSEAFQYLQDRMYDVTIPERARNHVYLIIAKIRTWMSLHHAYGWKESSYAY